MFYHISCFYIINIILIFYIRYKLLLKPGFFKR
jgi:hypothetical protein